MLTPESLDRLEAQARAQQGKDIGTGVFVLPGELLALIEAARAQQPAQPAETASHE